MNCANHPDVQAVAYCRTCGKPLCAGCTRDVRGVMYCEECLAAQLSGTMPVGAAAAQTASNTPRPGLAAILGLIPGVGAMYNGEYAKGFVHVLIFATLIWLAGHVHGVFGLGIAAFYMYMPIEAYRTAKARELGVPAPDPFGFNNLFGTHPAPVAPVNIAPGIVAGGVAGEPGGSEPAELEQPGPRVPVGAVILIGLGVLFLLDEMNLLHFDWIWRFWPLILIAIGVRILMKRQAGCR